MLASVGMYVLLLLALVAFPATFVTVASQSTGDIRLVDGVTSSQGRVEIYYNRQWGTVCNDDWSRNDAEVVCRQLGFSSGTVLVSTPAGSNQPIWLDDVSCSGLEQRLVYCSASSWGQHNCFHSEDAGVSCSRESSSSYGDVRLVGGETSNQGRVEIYYSGLWGTVCDDRWDQNDATVVCRQLGYSGGAVLDDQYFPDGSSFQPIWLDEVSCSGSESRLANCGFPGWGNDNCNHYEDAGVSCYGSGGTKVAVSVFLFTLVIVAGAVTSSAI